MKRWEDFMEDESGMGVVEIILIMVVLIAMCVIFKQQITSLVNNIWNSIKGELYEKSGTCNGFSEYNPDLHAASGALRA